MHSYNPSYMGNGRQEDYKVKDSKTLSQKTKIQKRSGAEHVIQAVEYLPSMPRALGSIPNTKESVNQLIVGSWAPPLSYTTTSQD
jgi:hypothetical protein